MKKIEKSNFFFYGMLLTIMIVPFLLGFDFDNAIDTMNTTIYAFSYRYGFMSRGFMGTILLLIGKIFGDAYYSYHTIWMISMGALILFGIVFLGLAVLMLHKTKDKKMRDYEKSFLLFSAAFLFPIFMNYGGFGRTDLFMILLGMICCLFIIQERFVFMVIPLTACATMMHQGYIFMFYSFVVVLLLYKALFAETRRKYYWTILIIDLVVVLGLAVYFEVFSHNFIDGENIYHEVVNTAKFLSASGEERHRDIIRHEVLGEDLSASEWDEHVNNFKEMAVFVVMFSPFICVFIKFFKNLIAGTKGKEKFFFIVSAIGSLTILPDIIFKIDYGRWVYAILVYYVMMISGLLIMQNQKLQEAIYKTIEEIKGYGTYVGIFLAIYFVMFQPFSTVDISKLTTKALNYIGMLF